MKKEIYQKLFEINEKHIESEWDLERVNWGQYFFCWQDLDEPLDIIELINLFGSYIDFDEEEIALIKELKKEHRKEMIKEL